MCSKNNSTEWISSPANYYEVLRNKLPFSIRIEKMSVYTAP